MSIWSAWRAWTCGIAAGLRLVAWLPETLDETAVIEAAASAGVAIAGVSPYRLAPSARGGLISATRT